MISRVVRRAWAMPWTLVGIGIGMLALVSGGGVQRRWGAIEFHGGGVAWLLGRLPGPPVAMTLGHAILGRSTEDLEAAREHEWVHVRQYERWGLFFVPAYLLISLSLWLRGRDAYRENAFEREAFARHDPRRVAEMEE